MVVAAVAIVVVTANVVLSMVGVVVFVVVKFVFIQWLRKVLVFNFVLVIVIVVLMVASGCAKRKNLGPPLRHLHHHLNKHGEH